MIQEMTTKQKELKKEISSLSAKFNVENAHRIRIEHALKHLLSSAQIDLVIGRKKRVWWTSDDISKAFAIRYLSKRCYVYLRERLKYPLPGISSLQRWAAQIDLRKGALLDVFRIMDVAGQTMTPFEKLVVVMFDEVKVASTYEYDKAADEVVGPHNQLQVVMVRTLFSKCKQPIYLQFDQKITKDILCDLVSKLHDISYCVVACVSHCGGGNVGLWNELGITIDHPYFVHEPTAQKIYFFADAPHLLKLIRNWLLDTGFLLEDGTEISAEPLKDLVRSTDTEVNSCYRISKAHLECTGAQRQNVTLAAELLSHTVATALKGYQPGSNTKLARDTGEFVEKVNDWFDIFNSYTTEVKLESKKPFGWILERQVQTLEEMSTMIAGMRCKGKRVLQIFQKGILMSINSLRLLFDDLKGKYDISYICTSRLNQDPLENFFSQLRSRGGLNDHPTPLNSIYRIRMIILGKNPGIVQKNVNYIHSRQDTEEDYIMAKVISSTINVILPPDIEHMQCDSDIDSDTTSTSSDVGTNRRTPSLEAISEQDGLVSLAGWVARKLKDSHPGLGIYTHQLRQDHSYGVPNWLSRLSFGGLTQPSDQWSAQATLLNDVFIKFHKKGLLRKGPKVTQKLVKRALQQHPEIDETVARTYLLQRTFIRIDYLNLKRKERASVSKRLATHRPDKMAKKRIKIMT